MDLDVEGVFSVREVYMIHRVPRTRLKTHIKKWKTPKGFPTLIANKKQSPHKSLQTSEAIFDIPYNWCVFWSVLKKPALGQRGFGCRRGVLGARGVYDTPSAENAPKNTHKKWKTPKGFPTLKSNKRKPLYSSREINKEVLLSHYYCVCFGLRQRHLTNYRYLLMVAVASSTGIEAVRNTFTSCLPRRAARFSSIASNAGMLPPQILRVLSTNRSVTS